MKSIRSGVKGTIPEEKEEKEGDLKTSNILSG